MTKSTLLIGVSVFALSAPAVAIAQDFTYGFGLEAGESGFSSGGATETYDYQLGFVQGRLTYEVGSDIYVGGQLSYGMTLNDDPANIAVQSIARASLVGVYDVGAVDLFATAGYGSMNVDYLGGVFNEDLSGATYSVGLEYAYSNNAKFSVELVQDQFKNDSGLKTDAENTALRVGAAFEF